MNWYKKAKIEFPTWLSRKLIEETNQYQQVMNTNYPEQKFLPKDINLVRLWAEQTTPNLESYTLENAIKNAQEWYNKSPLPKTLNKEDVDLNAIYYALQSSELIRKLEIDRDSLIVNDTQEIISSIITKPAAMFSYKALIQFDAINKYNNQKERWGASLVTKNGKYFSFSQAKRYPDSMQPIPKYPLQPPSS